MLSLQLVQDLFCNLTLHALEVKIAPHVRIVNTVNIAVNPEKVVEFVNKYAMNIKLHTLFLLFISSLGACGSSNSGYGTDYYAPSYEENLMTVKQQELQSPTQFLSLEATYYKNLVGKWIIKEI